MKSNSSNFKKTQAQRIKRLAFYFTSVSLLAFVFIGNAYGKEYICAVHGAYKTKCNVWRSGREVAIGGYQAAPIFTLTGNGTAVDQRGEKYRLINSNGNTTFSPLPGNDYQGVTIYGADIR